jgi:hypothetical protein
LPSAIRSSPNSKVNGLLLLGRQLAQVGISCHLPPRSLDLRQQDRLVRTDAHAQQHADANRRKYKLQKP